MDSRAFSRFSARRSLRARADCFELLTADLSAIVGPFRIGNRELTSTIPNKRNKSSSAAEMRGGSVMPGRDEGSGGASAGGSPIRDALRPRLSGPVVVKHQSGASEVQGAQEISRGLHISYRWLWCRAALVESIWRTEM